MCESGVTRNEAGAAIHEGGTNHDSEGYARVDSRDMRVGVHLAQGSCFFAHCCADCPRHLRVWRPSWTP